MSILKKAGIGQKEIPSENVSFQYNLSFKNLNVPIFLKYVRQIKKSKLDIVRYGIDLNMMVVKNV